MIKWGLCEHGGEASKDWFLSHISSIYSTPRCRYHAQAYNPENRCPTSKQEAWWSSEVCVNMAAKQAKIDFCRTFRPFIQHHDADIMHRRTIRRTDVQLLNRRLGDQVRFVWTWRRSKQRLIFVAHFVHLFNTTMPISCIDVQSGEPMSNF